MRLLPPPLLLLLLLLQDRTGQDRIGQDRTGQDRTEQDRTGQDRTGQDRTGQDRVGQDRTGPDRTGQDRTGQDRPGQDRIGQGRTGPTTTTTTTILTLPFAPAARRSSSLTYYEPTATPVVVCFGGPAVLPISISSSSLESPVSMLPSSPSPTSPPYPRRAPTNVDASPPAIRYPTTDPVLARGLMMPEVLHHMSHQAWNGA